MAMVKLVRIRARCSLMIEGRLLSEGDEAEVRKENADYARKAGAAEEVKRG